MHIEAKVEQLLTKAKQADDAAAKAPDSETRETWIKIAEQYRELANLK